MQPRQTLTRRRRRKMQRWQRRFGMQPGGMRERKDCSCGAGGHHTPVKSTRGGGRVAAQRSAKAVPHAHQLHTKESGAHTSTATFLWWSLISIIPKASIRVDFPQPGGPEIPILNASRGPSGKRAGSLQRRNAPETRSCPTACHLSLRDSTVTVGRWMRGGCGSRCASTGVAEQMFGRQGRSPHQTWKN
jgi:hypothetical protein